LATGVSAIPKREPLPELAPYQGTAIHSADYVAADVDRFPSAIVIGTGTSAHDVAQDLATGSSESYPTVELDDVAELAPQLVLVPSEPYDFSDEHVAELRDRFTHARIVRVDGKDLFWWGARTAGAINRLAEAIG